MTVEDLRKALAELPPEYDASVVVVAQPGMGVAEATRLILIPTFTGLDGRYSFEEFDQAVWLCAGGVRLSKEAEAEGWTVAYHNPSAAEPSRTLKV